MHFLGHCKGHYGSLWGNKLLCSSQAHSGCPQGSSNLGSCFSLLPWVKKKKKERERERRKTRQKGREYVFISFLCLVDSLSLFLSPAFGQGHFLLSSFSTLTLTSLAALEHRDRDRSQTANKQASASTNQHTGCHNKMGVQWRASSLPSLGTGGRNSNPWFNLITAEVQIL